MTKGFVAIAGLVDVDLPHGYARSIDVKLSEQR
jgi:hypothetical protein